MYGFRLTGRVYLVVTEILAKQLYAKIAILADIVKVKKKMPLVIQPKKIQIQRLVSIVQRDSRLRLVVLNVKLVKLVLLIMKRGRIARIVVLVNIVQVKMKMVLLQI